MLQVLVVASVMFIQGCSWTVVEFEMSQFKICKSRYFCGKVGKVGLDLITGERICVCNSGRRLRYYPADVPR